MNQCMFYRKLSYTVYIVFNTLSFISDLLASIVYIVMVQCYKGYMYENSWCICFSAIHTIKQICLLLDLYTASVLFFMVVFVIITSNVIYSVDDCSNQASVTSETKFYSCVASMEHQQWYLFCFTHSSLIWLKAS